MNSQYKHDADNLFQLGVAKLCDGDGHSAIIIFRGASKLGHKEASKFVKILTGGKYHVSS